MDENIIRDLKKELEDGRVNVANIYRDEIGRWRRESSIKTWFLVGLTLCLILYMGFTSVRNDQTAARHGEMIERMVRESDERFMSFWSEFEFVVEEYSTEIGTDGENSPITGSGNIGILPKE